MSIIVINYSETSKQESYYAVSKFKSIKPPFDKDPDNFNLSEYSERTLILPRGTSKPSRTRALKSHKRGGRTEMNKPKLQKSLSKTSLFKGFLIQKSKPVVRYSLKIEESKEILYQQTPRGKI